MTSDDPLGIIELGNKKIKCIIFKIIDNNIEILSSSINDSNGFYNDVVVNPSKASSTIRLCISSAEKKAKVLLKKINLIFEQPDFLCTKFSKQKKIDGSKIYKEDIEFLLSEAKKQLLLNDKKQTLIHIFNYNYIVDGKKFIEEPINIYADSLTHEITFISLPKNNLKNINQVFIDCDIKIERFISRIFSLGAKILTTKELELGSVIVDLGSDKTSIGLFKNFALIHSNTFPIGVSHITKDIAKVCSLNLDESESIRNDFDFLFKDNSKIFDEKKYLKKNYFINSKYRKISEDLISKVIKARMDEIFEVLKKQLNITDLNSTTGISFLIFGGGSNFLNIEKYFTDYFDLHVKKFDSGNSDKEYIFKKEFASCLGGIKIIKDGWETEAIPKKTDKNNEKTGFFSKVFGIR
mgnify:CR=1 FL=1